MISPRASLVALASAALLAGCSGTVASPPDVTHDLAAVPGPAGWQLDDGTGDGLSPGRIFRGWSVATTSSALSGRCVEAVDWFVAAAATVTGTAPSAEDRQAALRACTGSRLLVDAGNDGVVGSDVVASVPSLVRDGWRRGAYLELRTDGGLRILAAVAADPVG